MANKAKVLKDLKDKTYSFSEIRHKELSQKLIKKLQAHLKLEMYTQHTQEFKSKNCKNIR